MAKIAILPVALANQIAAGEVVERPASALKELVENALDAGATRCDVQVEGGGITRLLVKDNGSGMSPEDARLALQRHATSKLQRFEQLSELYSFGFRGEALPSIASVSRFTLRTRSEESDAGIELCVVGGETSVEQPCAMAVGTEVEVADLFYNVPARRKFLRSSGTEAGHLSEILEGAALSRPDVSFTLERDGRRAREWLRVRERGERVAQVLGDDNLGHCEGERGPLHVEAHLGRPEEARAGSNSLRLLCNGRPIRDRAVLHTIAQAYGSVLERGRYPRGVVYLDLPPELVDVNVHPQKTEVRFADSRAVCDALFQILSAELGRAFSLPAPARNRWFTAKESGSASIPPTASPSEAPSSKPQPISSVALNASANQSTTGHAAADEQATERRSYMAPRADGAAAGWQTGTPSTPAANTRLFTRDNQAERAAPTLFPDPQATPRRLPDADGEVAWSSLRYVAQVRSTFLVCESDAGLFLLDQHAAAERVTFDRLKKQYAAREAAPSQALLFPVMLELGTEAVSFLEEHSPDLERIGFEVQVRTETTASVHRVPQLLQSANPDRLVRDLLSELMRSGREYSQALDLALATLACHGSLRAGETIREAEAQALLSALDAVEFAGHCPHGRPIVSFTPWDELERKVGRR